MAHLFQSVNRWPRSEETFGTRARCRPTAARPGASGWLGQAPRCHTYGCSIAGFPDMHMQQSRAALSGGPDMSRACAETTGQRDSKALPFAVAVIALVLVDRTHSPQPDSRPGADPVTGEVSLLAAVQLAHPGRQTISASSDRMAQVADFRAASARTPHPGYVVGGYTRKRS
jgi:hypothetical protein